MLRKIKGFLFTNQTVRQTVAKNTFWLAVGNVGGRLIRAVVIVYAARVLGTAEWGTFSYATTLVAFLTIFVDFGINAILMRESVRSSDTKKQSEILSTSFFLKIFFLAVGVLVIILVAPYIIKVKGAEAILPIVALVLVFDTLRQFGFSLNQTLERMEREAGLFLLTNLAIVAFGFLFLLISPTVKSFAYAYALGTGVGMAATFFVLRNHLKRLFFDFKYKLIGPILGAAWPFALSGILGILMINTDILIIGFLRPVEEVGLFAAADRIIQVFYILPSILAISVLPVFSRLANRDNRKMRMILERVILVSLLVAIPVSVGGFILAPGVMTTIFGVEYAPGATAFGILALTLMINFPAVILSNAIFTYNKQKNLIINAAIGGGSNVVLDLLLIPSLGIAGAALATLGAQILSNIYLWHTMKKINDFRVLPGLKKIAAATAGMAVLSSILATAGVNVLATITLSIFLYFGILYWFKEPLFGELKLIVRPEG